MGNAHTACGGAASSTCRFDQILHQHYDGLLSSLACRCHSRVDAKDLLHDAVCITIEHYGAGRLRDVERMPGYVYRTALNLLRNHRRVMFNRPQCRAPVELADTLSHATSPDHADDASFTRSQLHFAITALPVERDRTIIRRFYFDGHSKPDICRDLNISPIHFARVLFRARQRMKELLALDTDDGRVDATFRPTRRNARQRNSQSFEARI